MLDYFQKLYRNVDALNVRFPEGNEPFKIITRLCEEAGELASEINHFERIGVKIQKHGEPDRQHLAKEVQDVMRAALAIARYYHIEQELQISIDNSYRQAQENGHIPVEEE